MGARTLIRLPLRRPRPTVRLRLALTYTLLFVLTGTALLGVSYLLVRQREKNAATTAKIICTQTLPSPAAALITGQIPTPDGGLSPSLPLTQAECHGVVESFYGHAAGSLIGSGLPGVSSGQNVVHVLPSGGGVSDTSRNNIRISTPTAETVRTLTAAVTASQTHTLDSLKIASLIALGIITILSFGFSWWIAGRMLRPVHLITDAARRLSEQTLHRRIDLQGPNDELKELADTFDAMLARLDSAFHSQRRFVANASHELRTPLATERVLIDEALADRSAGTDDLRSILEQLRSNSEETERLVDALLTLARSERGIETSSDVDLASTTESVIAGCALEAVLKGVEVRSDLSPAIVTGDPALLERLVGNLVQNAIRHNVEGGWADVTVSADGPFVVVEVANTGPALDKDTVATLTEPFRRAGTDRSHDDGGFGVGLSIVDAVVSAHQGSLELVPRPEGGLSVQIRLPRAPALAATS